MGPSELRMILELGEFAIQTARQYQNGEITEDEMKHRWQDMQTEIRDANDLWEKAGQ